MKKLTICIFDMDGLLINSERQMWMENERKAFKYVGHDTDDDFLKSMMGISGEDIKNKVLAKYGKDFPYDTYNKEVYRLNDETIERGTIDLMPGAKNLLDYLKSKHIRCVIGTGTPKVKAIKILTKLNLMDYFEEVYSGYDVENGKPAPDIYLKCLGNVSNKEAFVFEDSLNGAKSSIAAGIDLILVPDVCPISDEVKKQAYKVLNNLDEAIPLIKEIIE